LEDFDRLARLVTFSVNRDVAFTIISPPFLANSVAFTMRPELETVFIVFSLAETNTSAGEPVTIWAASVADEP
jgi:hypothetical protein